MQAIVSRFPGREETLVVGGGGGLVRDHRVTSPQVRSSLRDCIVKFRDHHSYCSGRRRRAVAFETRLEVERTEFLSRKYTETVKQEQGSTACAGLVSNNSITHTSSSTPSTNTVTHQVFGTTTAGERACYYHTSTATNTLRVSSGETNSKPSKPPPLINLDMVSE